MSSFGYVSIDLHYVYYTLVFIVHIAYMLSFNATLTNHVPMQNNDLALVRTYMYYSLELSDHVYDSILVSQCDFYVDWTNLHVIMSC
jgi:hypothetical protein